MFGRLEVVADIWETSCVEKWKRDLTLWARAVDTLFVVGATLDELQLRTDI